ncbi:MAG: hypothetical protein KF852_06600 [Saprospiraceae bacterium]|nr:hypothetical protein [Saprospiraceae bacterium]
MKYYKITQHNQDRVVLEHAARNLSRLTGFLLLLLASIAVYFVRDPLSGLLQGVMPGGKIWLVMGLILAFGNAGIVLLLRRSDADAPYRFTFDNIAGVLRLSFRNHQGEEDFSIPYHNIAALGIRKERAPNLNNKTARIDYYWMVYLLLKDGSLWDFNTFYNGKGKAEAMLELLQKQVNLSAPDAGVYPVMAPETIALKRVGDQTELEWKNNSLSDILRFLPFLLGMAGIAIFLSADAIARFSAQGSQSWLGPIFPALFIGALLLIGISSSRQAFGRYALRIGAVEVVLGKYRRGVFVPTQSLPLKDIAGAYYQLYNSGSAQTEALGLCTHKGLSLLHGDKEEVLPHLRQVSPVLEKLIAAFEGMGVMEKTKVLFQNSKEKIQIRLHGASVWEKMMFKRLLWDLVSHAKTEQQ